MLTGLTFICLCTCLLGVHCHSEDPPKNGDDIVAEMKLLKRQLAAKVDSEDEARGHLEGCRDDLKDLQGEETRYETELEKLLQDLKTMGLHSSKLKAQLGEERSRVQQLQAQMQGAGLEVQEVPQSADRIATGSCAEEKMKVERDYLEYKDECFMIRETNKALGEHLESCNKTLGELNITSIDKLGACNSQLTSLQHENTGATACQGELKKKSVLVLQCDEELDLMAEEVDGLKGRTENLKSQLETCTSENAQRDTEDASEDTKDCDSNQECRQIREECEKEMETCKSDTSNCDALKIKENEFESGQSQLVEVNAKVEECYRAGKDCQKELEEAQFKNQMLQMVVDQQDGGTDTEKKQLEGKLKRISAAEEKYRRNLGLSLLALAALAFYNIYTFAIRKWAEYGKSVTKKKEVDKGKKKK